MHNSPEKLGGDGGEIAKGNCCTRQPTEKDFINQIKGPKYKRFGTRHTLAENQFMRMKPLLVNQIFNIGCSVLAIRIHDDDLLVSIVGIRICKTNGNCTLVAEISCEMQNINFLNMHELGR